MDVWCTMMTGLVLLDWEKCGYTNLTINHGYNFINSSIMVYTDTMEGT